jgi:hypothetical protein
VAGPGTTLIVAPSITVNNGTVTIAAVGGTVAQDQLLFCYAIDGTSTWYPETVAFGANEGPGPSITSNDGAANIADFNSAGQLEYYWAADGTSTWNAEAVPGNGTGPNA